MNPWRGLRNLPREVWILSAATLINRAGTMALPFLVLYLTQRLGFSAGRAGFTFTIYGVGALVTSPIAGRLCDRFGALRIVKLSLLLSGLVVLAFPLARSFAVILIMTMLWAVLSEAFRPAGMAITAELVPPEQRKPAFALSRLAINLGMSIGPAVGGFLATVSFPALFFVDGTTSILAGLVLVGSSWPTVRQGTPPAMRSETNVIASIRRPGVLSDGRFLYFLIALIPIMVVFFQHVAAMPLYLVRDLHLQQSIYGMLITLNTVLIILLEVPLNTAMAHWPHRRGLALGAFLCGAGFGGLAFATEVWGVAGTVVIWTLGEIILLPSTAAYVADMAPPERRGEYMGLYMMTSSLAFTIGPWIGAEILERFGARVLWSATFVCAGLSALMMSRVYSRAPCYEKERARP